MATYSDEGAGGGAELSDDAPEAVGTADEGVSEEASRADHVHAHGNQLGGALHANATGAAAGFMTAALFTKLDDLPTDADLTTALAGKASTAHAATHVTGSSDVIASAVASGDAGLMTGADKAKLDGIAAGATVGITQSRDHFKQTGTSPVERWELAGQVGTAAVADTATGIPSGQLVAIPLLSLAGGTVDKISIRVSAGGVASVRCGIYSSTSATNRYPDALVAGSDTGAIAGTDSSGVKTTAVTVTLLPNVRYWVVVLTNGTTVKFYGIPAASCFPVLGCDDTMTTLGLGFAVAQAYGALPATFPAAAAIFSPATSDFGATNPNPAIAIHFSA